MFSLLLTHSTILLTLVSTVLPQMIHQLPLQPRQATTITSQNANQATTTSTTAQGSQTGTSRAATTSSTYSAPIDSPVGGLVFTQPPATAAASYYKIAQDQPLTFGWNYTNILSFGNSITIVAYCSLNKVSYTISTLPAQATAITWDPYALQQQPGFPLFAEATYTLQIFDERGMGAGPTPGLMAPSSQMKFAMYKPQPYTPLASWTCSTCSGAKGFFQNNSPVLLACALSLVTAIGGGWYGVLAAIR
ncbi:hypothetical protein PCANC_10635 [Puccinia coronata f. sp. avenae]|uniref:DUF7137 domain-containing protein n=1 Tax=Puccinia coronata f. sp. avenae TaxID=200324 RepID=A0A2N5T170_9BASI|nr:hypothetical protein PCANC_09970 [Puccinia coronata f. sp. avenae]PLW44762.1 hypothetical protein PCANC_10635 [Puccinia coronata f. sp. avenae]